MAVTQYIGSRYVPLFADPAEWSATKTYEALTIVLHQGNSFTSKQFVPVGIDINNEKYWAETGNYNAQVEQYRRDVLEYREDVETINSALPIESFNEDNTVKKYIDDSINAISAGANPSFEMLYAGVDLEVSNTPYYLFRIPQTERFTLLPYNRTDSNMYEQLRKLNPTRSLFINGSLGYLAISDGVILGNASNDYTIMGVRNGVPAVRNQLTAGQYSASSLLEDGWTLAFGVFSIVIQNGLKYDIETYSGCSWYTEGKTPIVRGQRSCLGWDGDYWYVFCATGRRPYATGFNNDEIYKMCVKHDIANMVNMDGGGSSQLYLTDPITEITSSFDTTHGDNITPVVTRNVPHLLHFGG